MEKSNVRLDTNSGNGKPEQQRKLDSTMEMGQSLEGSENKGSSYIETEGVIILDTFRGDIFQLIDSIKSLVELDIENALVPHGIGGLARSLLSSSAIRLEQLRQRVAELERERDALKQQIDDLLAVVETAYKVASEHDDRLPFDWAMYCEMLYQAISSVKGSSGKGCSSEWLQRRLQVADDGYAAAGRPCNSPSGCNGSNCLGCGEEIANVKEKQNDSD